jgi:hypothetical protein
MTTLTFTERELTYLMLSLKVYEARLLEAEGEDFAEGVNDLLIIQPLYKKLEVASAPQAEISPQSTA